MICKILLLGDYGTGKSTFFKQLLKTFPDAQLKPAIKLELVEIKREIDGKEVILQVFDIPGRELTAKNRSKHYKNAVGAIIFFDISRPDSFRHAPFWIEELMNYNGYGKVPIVLLGNKADLRESSERTLNDIDARQFIFRLNRTTKNQNVESHYFEISAKNPKGIPIIIDTLIRSILQFKKEL
ncbi:MAG: Rab family GTPase [Candidatus Heimdallarchaeaceae archaeon]